MTKTRQILCVDPDPSELRIEALLNRQGISATLKVARVADVLRDALAQSSEWDLVLGDADLCQDPEVEALLGAALEDAEASLVLLQARNEGRAVTPATARRLGAADIVRRGNMEHLLFVCERELQSGATRKELRQLRQVAADSKAARPPLVLATIHDLGKAPRANGEITAGMHKAARRGHGGEQALSAERIKGLIDAGGLTLEFQPIISIHGEGERRGMFETLVRLRDETGALLLPSAFLPVVAQAGWMGKIDVWIFRRVLAILEQMQDGGHPDAVLFVNLATSTLGTDRLVAALGAFASAANVPPGSLVVEVRKSAFDQASAGLERLTKMLRAQHHGLLVEDVRPDDCPLVAKNRDFITHVKLDQGVAKRLIDRRISHGALAEFVQCAKHEGVGVIALAVESAELLSMFFRAGVDAIQGHFVSQPYSELVYPTVQSVDAGAVPRWGFPIT